MTYWGCVPGEISKGTGESVQEGEETLQGCNFNQSPSLIPWASLEGKLQLRACPDLRQGDELSFPHLPILG